MGKQFLSCIPGQQVDSHLNLNLTTSLPETDDAGQQYCYFISGLLGRLAFMLECQKMEGRSPPQPIVLHVVKDPAYEHKDQKQG